jgi:DNA-binding HxlR family transcriptional regulator
VKEEDAVAVLELLHDEYARDILTETSTEPMSATELADACDASLSTIYRRVDELDRRNLVRTETEYDPDGDHYEVYEAAVDHVGFDIEDGTWSLDVSRTDRDAGAETGADRFTRAWEGIRGGDEK